MEGILLSFPIIIMSLILILLFHIIFKQHKLQSEDDYKTKSSQQKQRLPPGSKGLPWVGETLELMSSLKSGNVDKFIVDRMKRHSPDVFRTSLFGDTFVVMCGSEASKFVLSNDIRLFRTWWPRSMNRIFSQSLSQSFSQKSIAAVFVKPGGMKRFVGVMDSIARRQLLSDWEGHHQVTVLPITKSYTFAVACELLLSVEDVEVIAKLKAPTRVLALGLFSLPINLPGTRLNRAIKASREVKPHLAQIVRKRRIELFGPQGDHHIDPTRTQSFGDMLTHLLMATSDDGKRMTDMEIADRMMGILIAAHDTTSAVTTLTFKYIADHPHIYDAVFQENAKVAEKKESGELLTWDDIQEMKYTWNVAREVMRVSPVLQGLFREVVKDFTYAGYLIPKGWKVYLSVNSTHNDTKSFVNPHKFDPSRFEGEPPEQYTYVPFGGGVHMCPGKNYAQLEILVFLHNVVKRFRWEMVDPDEKIIVYPMPMPAKGLRVRLYPHQL